jgi:hypothetical protein
MWITLFTMAIGIALFFALGAVALEAYEKNDKL